MAKSSPTRKSLPALIGGAVLVLVAGYFGIDLGGGSGDQGDKGDAAKHGNPDSLSTCAMDSLPREAADTTADILAGGPYEYPDNDNARFGNYEGRLPQESRDYYREYTVDTPGLDHRGAKRIITGGGSETDPDVWYYTDDHYESFCSIPDAEQKAKKAES